VSNTSEFCLYNPLCCFLTSVYCCKRIFCYDSFRELLDIASYFMNNFTCTRRRCWTSYMKRNPNARRVYSYFESRGLEGVVSVIVRHSLCTQISVHAPRFLLHYVLQSAELCASKRSANQIFMFMVPVLFCIWNTKYWVLKFTSLKRHIIYTHFVVHPQCCCVVL
jgi:hypothetical protein